MPIDFSAVHNRQMKYADLAASVSKADLLTATHESINRILALLDGLTDADVVFEPHDPHAHDPYAVAGEEQIGWSLAHLVAHVTASSEEGAAFSSLLARGIAASERPRYETPWRDLTTVAQLRQRLEESRRIRVAYLDTWPDKPHLDIARPVSERFEAWAGKLNAIGAFLLGLGHEVGHYEQMRDARAQALAARAEAAFAAD